MMKINKLYLLVTLVTVVALFTSFSKLVAKESFQAGITCCEGISTCSNGKITIMAHYIGENNKPCPPVEQ